MSHLGAKAPRRGNIIGTRMNEPDRADWRSRSKTMLLKWKLSHVARGAVIICLLVPVRLHAGVALDQVRATADQVLTILNDPKFDGTAGREKQRDELRQAIYPRFDFIEMSRRSLGATWRQISTAEQNDFVQLFTRLLEEAYLSNIQDFKGEKVLYIGDVQEPDHARVDSQIISKRGESLAVNYSLHKVGEDWKVYDIVIENISIVNNYRAQLSRLTGQLPFSEVLARIREKIPGGPGAVR